MKRFIYLIFVILWVNLSGCVTTEENNVGMKLSGDWLEKNISGNSFIYSVNSNQNYIIEYFEHNGSVYFFDSVTNKLQVGTWIIEEEALCKKYETFFEGVKTCFDVERMHGLYLQRHTNGDLEGSIPIGLARKVIGPHRNLPIK